MDFVAVCGAGMGSSMLGVMNIENILKEVGIDGRVSNTDIGSVTGISADYYITTEEMFPNFPENLKEKTIIVDNFINQQGLETTILARLKLDQKL